ncbi:DVU_1551 family NTP transferase [Desulfovibrio aminophilus]|uniref:DVU_1551 family NTP transferase n=1 Tax=Desulfovibrio aminophilus TaxID=81425 RepID=UPI00339A595C
MRLAALILAAGLSSRMGRLKPLLALGDASLLGRAADLFRNAEVADILVVTGHRADEVRAEAERLGLRSVHNPDFETGMFSSVLTGLRALPPGLDGVFILPVDIPLVRPATLRRLIERLPESQTQALVPALDGEPGHPPLLRPTAVDAALAWTGAGGLREALAALEVEPVEVADAGILFDLDTPEAYAEALRRWERRNVPTRAEALALLRLQQAGERGLAHAQGVARSALILGRALVAAGSRLDFELLEVAALLHDIAKGSPEHEKAGGLLLADLGYAPVAEIVAAHRDIDPAGLDRPGERELVYLADKLMRGWERVNVEQRFQEKLDRFAHDPKAVAAIIRRREHALAMQALVEHLTGRRLDAILDAEGPWD